ncbi:Predicted Zn-dependent peptidase [Pustulibacterium marinum]|uniref:Predicted Zn-dependent peptidase n=1 Tax=Pustulibacterium marinum TaxID=1224947 RepID=A0A1I7IH08_9FLAO|nr:M16 family metallopeptidase [Pustulibacterium marinum]SFU72195.1 Predicted Zn-dependent peptidase [Pustulibacterium marinum]
MKKIKKLLFFLMIPATIFVSCDESRKTNEDAVVTEEHTDDAGFSYETVTNDPTGLRLYTLDNGLKVYLSQNTDEPKIQTYIAVRAGSNYDPKETTGLAHYLEHMVFKGTSKIGTLDWEKEKEYLQQISDLYEEHKAATDSLTKDEIYRKIDEVSLEASNYSVANEYDKMVQSLGATGTNAHTWFEETVYQNKIPANELNKWLSLESDRFSELTLRLFHTELEAVFEEFNRGQDNDYRKVYAASLEGLFPNHPYGQQTTIGTGDHLKNPSMVAIHNYFDKYYVPSNMAMVLVGDIDFDKTIKEVNETFGKLQNKEVRHPQLPKEEPITSPIEKEVYGPTAENISIAFRADGIGSKDQKYVTLCDMILANGTAGLIDLDLNQKQVVQRASCSPTFLNDYGYHTFTGTPKSDQSLDEVKDLLLGEIEKLKKGEFEDWMIDAVVNDLKLSRTRRYENATALASAYYNAFIHHENWQQEVAFLDDLKKITKEDLVKFANNFYQENYVVVYKRQGEDKSIVKVKNPGITPVNLNRDKKSEYLQHFSEMESEDLQPQFVDYDKAINETELENGVKVSYIDNPQNDLFQMYILFDMGNDNNKDLGLAVDYIEYLGTDKYTAEELKKEFYKLGVEYYVGTGSDRTYVALSGLKENLPQGLALLEDLWTNAKPDAEAYDKYVDKISKGRQDTKTQKGSILWSGLMSFGQYGEDSPLRNIYSVAELKEKDPADLVNLVKGLKKYKQRVFYYGKDVDAAVAALNKEHKLPENLIEYPEAKEYARAETGGNVYFVNYDMVQAEMLFLAKEDPFDPEKMAASTLFNAYFGSGLSSIVFQEIRESKSLAYSAFSSYSNASKEGDPDYVYAYIGTQANKMPQAVDAMMGLMKDMPEAEEQFNAAKDAALKKIAAQRINKTGIFWNYESLKKRGIDHDNREEIYNTIKDMTMEDLKDFFNQNIKNSEYNVMVIGNEKEVDFEALSKLGKVQELDVDYLFNYEKSKELQRKDL